MAYAVSSKVVRAIVGQSRGEMVNSPVQSMYVCMYVADEAMGCRSRVAQAGRQVVSGRYGYSRPCDMMRLSRPILKGRFLSRPGPASTFVCA